MVHCHHRQNVGTSLPAKFQGEVKEVFKDLCLLIFKKETIYATDFAGMYEAEGTWTVT